MSASRKVFLKLGTIGSGAFLVILLSSALANRGILPRVVFLFVFAAAFVLIALIVVAPLGFGPFGHQLTHAALADEKSEWRD